MSTNRPGHRPDRWRMLLRTSLFPLLVLVLWQVGSALGLINDHFLPSVWTVLQSGWKSTVSGELPQDIWSSSQRVFFGLLAGVVTGIPLGIAMGMSALVDDALRSTMNVLKAIPPIAWIPLSILWFGLGNPPAVFLIFLGAFFPILVNTYAGVRGVDAIYLRAARNLGARGMLLFRDVVLMGALPSILTGLRVAVGVSWMVVVVAEMLAVNNGLGYRMLEARDYGWTDKIILGMLAVGLCGYAFDRVLLAINHRVLRWQRTIGS